MSEVNGAANGAATPAKAAKAKPEVAKVKMKDGREVEFVGKRLINKDSSVGATTLDWVLDFRNGESVKLSIPKDDPIIYRFALHGGEQKLGDEAAGVKDEATGAPDVDSMFLAIEALAARLAGTGEIDDRWYAERTAGDGFSGASIVIKAIAEARGDGFKERGDAEKAEAAYKDIAWVKAFLEKRLADDKAKGGTLTRQKMYQSFRAPGTKTGIIVERMESERKAPPPVMDANAELGAMFG